jgi:EAL and modified HD-GYP domain-containing signal transduction protein
MRTGQAEPDGFLTYALLLDSRKRIKGYKLAWGVALHEDGPDALDRLRALLSCAAANLNPPRSGWRLGNLALLFDMPAEGLVLEELQALPPGNVILCMKLEDLMDACNRPTLLVLHRQGFRFMLCDAVVLPEDRELCSILTYVDVGNGHPAMVAHMLRGQPPAMSPLQPVATHIMAWHEFDGSAAQGVDVLVRSIDATVSDHEAGAILQPETMLIVRMMQLIRRNEDVRSIEATLKHDAALTYRLLHHINSPGIGIGVQIQSLRQALAIFGYSPLFRWLSVLLATSNKAAADFMTKKAITRGRFVELMGRGIVPAHEADDLFLTGMFSLMDRLLGVSMEEVLDRVQLSEAVQLALLKREGPYGSFIALAETCEADGRHAASLSESILMSAKKVNAAHLTALAWAQDVASV